VHRPLSPAEDPYASRRRTQMAASLLGAIVMTAVSVVVPPLGGARTASTSKDRKRNRPRRRRRARRCARSGPWTAGCRPAP